MSNDQLPGVNGSATDLMHQPSRGLSTAAIAGITAGSAAAVAGAGGLAWKQYLKNKNQSAQNPSTPAIPDDLLQTSKNDSSIGTVGKLAIGGSALAATGNVVANVGNAAAGLANAASSVASGTVNVASSAVTGASNAISSVATATSNVIDAASNVAKTGYGAVTGGGAYVLNALQKNRVPAEGVSANTAGAGSTPNTPGGSGGGESPGIDPTTIDDEHKLDEELEVFDEDEIKTDGPALEQTPSAKDQLELSGNVDAPTDRLELPGIVDPPIVQEQPYLRDVLNDPGKYLKLSGDLPIFQAQPSLLDVFSDPMRYIEPTPVLQKLVGELTYRGLQEFIIGTIPLLMLRNAGQLALPNYS
jgi:hypothetical protein